MLTVSFTPAAGPAGTPVTMTVTGDMTEVDQITVTDPRGDTGSGPLTMIEALTVADPRNREWALQSNDGSTAVLTSVI